MRDSRLRKHLMKLSKLVKKQHDFQLAKLNRIDKEAQQNQELLLKKLKSAQKDIDTLTHQVELIEEELKVKPLNIKREIVLERFDHRLLIVNLVLIFLNIILLCK